MNKVKKAVVLVSAFSLMNLVSCGSEAVPEASTAEKSQISVVSGVLEEEMAAEAVSSEGNPAETEAASTTEKTTTSFEKKLSGLTLSYNEVTVLEGETHGYPFVSEDVPEVWTSSDESIATVDSAGNITGKKEGECVVRVVNKLDETMGAEVKVTVRKAEGNQKVDGVTYIDGILIANKSYSLPQDYNPGGLLPETQSAFDELSQGAANDGLNIYISSGFRSYEYQAEIYNNYCDAYGQETADTFSARPGYSEHQSGLAIDVNIIDDSFAGTPEAIWLENHCNEYGFILRYPKGKQDITGYQYESWHIRYVGKEVAQAIKAKAEEVGDPSLTLEEYLGIDSKYSS